MKYAKNAPKFSIVLEMHNIYIKYYIIVSISENILENGVKLF